MKTTTTQSEPHMTPAGTAEPDAALAFWRERAGDAVHACLGSSMTWSRACAPKPVPDDAAKLVLRCPLGRPHAVLVGSASAAPEMAARHAERSQAAADALPDELAAVVLKPITQGEVDGRSYVVWPYRSPGGEGRLAQWRWRRRWSAPVSNWLFEVNQATCTPIAPDLMRERVVAPLEALGAIEGVSGRVCQSADQAAEAFTAGGVPAVHVLMHNDLWTGNVLCPEKASAGGRYPFTIIDWAGAEVSGYPAYDLARWAQSARLKASGYGAELVRHSGVLGCDPGAMRAHLAVGLGFLAMNLEGFSPQRFVRLADECLEGMENALAAAGVRITP
ncbi:hypothetical protein OT109_14150 [Phycisphaeraceae bacterium D3-23]